MTHSPNPGLSAREILILVQALRIAMEDGTIYDFARKQEIEAIREKLGNVK